MPRNRLSQKRFGANDRVLREGVHCLRPILVVVWDSFARVIPSFLSGAVLSFRAGFLSAI